MNISLGTVQFGLDYGVSNKSGKPSFECAKRVIDTALDSGIRSFDTARMYGNSEAVLGRALKGRTRSDYTLTTKLPNLQYFKETDSLSKSGVVSEIDGSLQELCVDELDCLLLHDINCYKYDPYLFWEVLVEQKAKGKIKELGFSINFPSEALSIIGLEHVSKIQLPFNYIDYRWEEEPNWLAALESNPGVHIEARSLFLQGLLLNAQESWLVPKEFHSEADMDAMASNACSMFGLNSRLALCLSYAMSTKWIHSCVIGVQNTEELNEIIEAGFNPELPQTKVDEFKNMRTSFKYDEKLLFPGNW